MPVDSFYSAYSIGSNNRKFIFIKSRKYYFVGSMERQYILGVAKINVINYTQLIN